MVLGAGARGCRRGDASDGGAPRARDELRAAEDEPRVPAGAAPGRCADRAGGIGGAGARVPLFAAGGAGGGRERWPSSSTGRGRRSGRPARGGGRSAGPSSTPSRRGERLEIVLIGIGTGNPEHMTVQGIRALNAADLVLVPRKGAAKDDLAELRREICGRYLENRGDAGRRVRPAGAGRGRAATGRGWRPGTGRSRRPTAGCCRRTRAGAGSRCSSGAIPRSTTARCGSSSTCAAGGRVRAVGGSGDHQPAGAGGGAPHGAERHRRRGDGSPPGGGCARRGRRRATRRSSWCSTATAPSAGCRATAGRSPGAPISGCRRRC